MVSVSVVEYYARLCVAMHDSTGVDIEDILTNPESIGGHAICDFVSLDDIAAEVYRILGTRMS